MIHGHIHNAPTGISDPHLLNAGVEINCCKPVALDELIRCSERFNDSHRHSWLLKLRECSSPGKLE